MPQNNPKPRPQVMTWGKALPVFAVTVIFDAVRFMFEQFWLFGPLVISVGGAALVSSWLGGGAVATGVGTAAGAGAGAAAAFFAEPVLVFFGYIMALATGLLGWLTLLLLIAFTNFRLFKKEAKNMLWLLLGLGISEVPLIGSLPALTGTAWKLYHDQIKKEKAELRAWEEEQKQLAEQERSEQLGNFFAERNLLLAEQAQASAEEGATNDNAIPEKRREAA